MVHFDCLAAQEVQQLRIRLGNVTKENKVLRDLLKKHSIAIPRKILVMQDSTSTVAAPDSVNVSVAMTTVSSKSKGAPAVVTMTKPPQVKVTSQATVTTSPAVVTMVTQVPITSASVTGPVLKDQSGKGSVAYVAPFIIANEPVSVTTSTTPTVTSVGASVIPVATPTVQNVGNPGQLEVNQPIRNVTSSANLSNPPQHVYPQLTDNFVYSSAQQPLQTLNAPVSSSQELQTSHTGFSQHSVAAIMKVALQPGASVSPINEVNATPLPTPVVGNSTTAVLNVQSAAKTSPFAASSTTAPAVLVSSPSVLPASSSLLNRPLGISNSTVAQSSSLPTFYVTAAPDQVLSVAMIAQNNGSVGQQKGSNDESNYQGGNKNKKIASANKVQTKSVARTQNSKRSSASKALAENKAGTATNKRGAVHLPVVGHGSMAKRTNTCNPHETQGNMNICQPQGEVMALQTFNVTALIPGIATQGSSPSNNVPTMVSNRDDCSKSITQVSTIGAIQTAQVPHLSHSIASLAGLSQSLGQPQSSSDLQQQQVSQLGSGNLSFSAESLLASNEVVLPNIPHITTTSVSENNISQQNVLTMVPSSSMHSTPNEQGHTQNFSNYSAEALIGGNEIMGESVITQETQMQTRPSRTTYSDFSAESLIGSNDLNSSLSYAIDNLISSRSDANYNSTAMVSVNPNLLHSVKANVSHDTGANPLRALAALPELVEQKSTIPSSQPTAPFSGTISNSTYGVSPSNCAPLQFTLSSNPNRRQRDNITQQQGVGQTVNSSNNVSVSSSSFLKHSVDSITSSFYAVNNTGSSLSLGPVSTSSSSFQPQGSFGVELLSGGQISFGSTANAFSPTRPFFNHSSTMGSFV